MLKSEFMYLIVLGVMTLLLGNQELCYGHRCHQTLPKKISELECCTGWPSTSSYPHDAFSLLYKGLPRDRSNGALSPVQLTAYTGNIGELAWRRYSITTVLPHCDSRFNISSDWGSERLASGDDCGSRMNAVIS